MYDIGNVKGNHFCILIFPQGKWKKNRDSKLSEKMQADWPTMVSVADPKEKNPLFDPKKHGKILKECKICVAIYEVFKKQMKDKTGLVLFSHYVPDETALKSLLTSLMEDAQVQKIYYLEQNSSFYLIPPDQFIAKVKNTQHERASMADFFRLMDYGRFETGILYEIFRQAVY